jgi:hypothetical protein
MNGDWMCCKDLNIFSVWTGKSKHQVEVFHKKNYATSKVRAELQTITKECQAICVKNLYIKPNNLSFIQLNKF